MNRKQQRTWAIVIILALIGSTVLALAGCTSDPLAEQFRSGDNKNYIAGDGTVTEFSITDRPSPNSWSGTTESGFQLESSALLGNVTVMNFWYAACAPCRAEAPDLAALHKEFSSKKVNFVGVNVRDTAETALAFDRKFGIEFPSVMDAQSGEVSLAFTGIVSPSAVPTTLVLDSNGKVTARILGRIEPAILKELIETALEESK